MRRNRANEIVEMESAVDVEPGQTPGHRDIVGTPVAPEVASVKLRLIAMAFACGDVSTAHEHVRQAFEEAEPKVIWLDSHVAELGLPIRISATLEKHGLPNVGQLVRGGPECVHGIRQIGPAGVELIRAALAKYGLAWGRDDSKEVPSGDSA